MDIWSLVLGVVGGLGGAWVANHLFPWSRLKDLEQEVTDLREVTEALKDEKAARDVS